MENNTRPWGKYEILSEGDGYKVKRLTINPKSILSLQKHHKRSEHWTVVQGDGFATKNETIINLKTDETLYIPVECVHRIENRREEDTLTIIEVQCGSYLGEDDIERLEDFYDRI